MDAKKPEVERPAPWFMTGTVKRWKIRHGSRVPAVECLPAPFRVSPKAFEELMAEMLGEVEP